MRGRTAKAMMFTYGSGNGTDLTGAPPFVEREKRQTAAGVRSGTMFGKVTIKSPTW